MSPDGYLNVSPDAEVELTCSCAAFNPTIQSYPAILNWKVRGEFCLQTAKWLKRFPSAALRTTWTIDTSEKLL